MASILTDIKKLFGISQSDKSFDTDLTIDINSAFSVLTQLGVGPESGFVITGSGEEWEEFIGDVETIELVKTYIFLKVKLMFDVSTLTSPMIESINRQVSEFEWRLNVAVDTKEPNEEGA